MLRRESVISFLVVCFILASVPTALCISSPPIIYVAGDGSGDYNCYGKSDQVQINQALQFVADNPLYTTVHLKGPFTYVIDSTLLIGSNTILEGDSNTVIKLADHAGWPAMKPLIQQKNNLGNDNITVRGFEVNGNYAGNSEIKLGKGYYNVMYFTYCDNVKVYNMYMHDGMGDGLRINKGKNVQFYNNRVDKLGHDGLYAIGCENVEAWNNRITCRTNSGLRIWNSNHIKFHDNVIDSFYNWNAGNPGIQIEKNTGIVNDVEIYNNTINNTYGPGIWLIGYGKDYPQEEAENIHIHNNIFYSTGTNPSLDYVAGIAVSGFYNTSIDNNVFDSIYHAAVINLYPLPSTGADSGTDLSPKGKGYTTILRNNIIVNTRNRTKDPGGTGYGVINYYPETHFFKLDNNCLYNNVGGDYKNCSSTTDIYVPPLVADLKNHDYHLQSKAGRWDGKIWVNDNVSSLCIDAGYRYSDYSSETEPNGNRINIGPDGNTQYASKSESVSSPVLPTANFSCNKTSGYAPLSVQFIDLSKNATEWKWDFGDGANSTQQNPMHTYSVPGIYTTKLTVKNASDVDFKTENISVVKDENTSSLLPVYSNRLREATPESIFSNNSYLDVGGTSGIGRYRDVILFDLSGYAKGTQINKAILSLIWYYPNSPRLNDTVIEIYRPASTWNSGYVSWNKKDKDTSWSSPGGNWYDKFGILQGNTPYATLTLKASSLPGNSYCEFDVTDLVREYTSGNYSNTGFLIKAHIENDNYIAFYSANCKLSLSTSILPTANFSSNVTTGTVPLSVQFNNLSKNATELNWNFGDGTNSNQRNPVHVYAAAGNYTVNLTASNLNGTNSKLATISVQKSIPEITWSKPADITYGTALGSSQLNAAASVSGTLVYTLAAGTVLSAGTQILHADFTPNDSSNYSGTSANIVINVLKSTPIITWSKPADIVYGTALGSTQINASASVPGTFAYAPATGTVLSTGIQTLHVDFTPADAANYTIASKNVTINVSEKLVLPAANFSANVTNGTAPLTVQFTDLSKNATSRTWNFGDSTNSTQQSPVHIYSAAGNYTATLTAGNSNGTDSMARNINVVKKEMTSNLSGIYNNRLREASPETIYSSSSFLDVGGMSGVGRYRDVIWFNLSEYTSDTQISNATLSLFWYYPNSSRVKDTVVEIYRPASFWNSSFVSWNKKNIGIFWNNSGGDWYDNNGVLHGSIPCATLTLRASDLPSNSYCEFNVTSIVREYVRGKYSNTGFLIKARNESDNYIAFYSAQYGNASKVPKLKLVYS